MADPILCDEILVTLEEQGPIKVRRACEFREAAGLSVGWSKTQVKKALGSLIHSGKVRRHRPELQSCSDVGQPITFRVSHH